MSHQTRKSFKNTVTRDKISHSASGLGEAKKGGGGGSYTWGKPGDEMERLKIDPDDPNYDPMDEALAPKNATRMAYSPPAEYRARFATSVDALNRFKRLTKDAADEFLLSNDYKELERLISDAKQEVYHQDLPYILIKHSFDKSADDRGKICSALSQLHDNSIVSSSQMAQGFGKLYNCLDDMLLDSPQARVYMREFVSHAIISGYLTKEAADAMREGQVEDGSADLKQAKKAIADFLVEYFESADVQDATASIKEIKPAFHFEVVKKVVSLALDRDDSAREKASALLASVAGDTIDSEAVKKGFTVLLERVEDLALDVPDVLKLMSCFLARAVADEALPPAFLSRVDLAARDMGSQVVEQAQKLLQVPHAAQRLSEVWGH